MPVCRNCKAVLPPTFFEVDDTQKDGVCIWCTRNSDEISYGLDNTKMYKKEDAVKEYQIFLKKLSTLPNVKAVLDEAEKPYIPGSIIKP